MTIGDTVMLRPLLLVDIETIARPDCAEYVKPARHLKDPSKVAASIAERVSLSAIDVDLALPVCVGLWFPGNDEPQCWWVGDHVPEAKAQVAACCSEREVLESLWCYMGDHGEVSIGGFHLGFDVLLLLRRSQLLGIRTPHIDTNRYRPHRCDDVMHRLTFKGELTPKGLTTYARIFGLPATDDDIDGADVPAAIARGEYARVERHCVSDLLITSQLFQRLGLGKWPATEAGVSFTKVERPRKSAGSMMIHEDEVFER